MSLIGFIGSWIAVSLLCAALWALLRRLFPQTDNEADDDFIDRQW